MKAIQKVCFCLGFLILLAANANAGRWLTRDPIEFMERDPSPIMPGMSVSAISLDDPQQINLYSYVLNNPINFIDPLGLIGTPAENLALVLAVGEEEAAETIGPAAARIAAQSIERKAAEELAAKAAQALEKRCVSNVGKLANKFRKSPQEIKDALHKAKDALQRYKGKGMKGNVDVTVDPTTGEVYPQIPGGGLGDTLGNISEFLP